MTTSSKPGAAVTVTSRESSGLLPDGLINAEDEQGLFTHLEWRNMGTWAVKGEPSTEITPVSPPNAKEDLECHPKAAKHQPSWRVFDNFQW